MNSSVACRILWSCGSVYWRDEEEVGETRGRLETRIKGHKDACRKGELGKPAIAEHAWNHHHFPILWEETSVVDGASKWKEMLVLEVLHT